MLISIPITWIMKWRHRTVKYLAKGHTARLLEKNLNPSKQLPLSSVPLMGVLLAGGLHFFQHNVVVSFGVLCQGDTDE